MTVKLAGVVKATSQAAGGYSAEKTGAGSVAVEFSGAGLASPVTVTIAATADNAKVDLMGARAVAASTSATLGSGALDLLLLGMANLNGAGNSAVNLLEGNRGANVLSGLGGADKLFGNAGNDVLTGGTGADQLNGGAGSDFADYSNAAAAVRASLASPAGNLGDAAGDTYVQIEGLRGSSFGDTLTGDGAANFINGRAGNDVLAGGLGNDTFIFDTALNAATNVDRITDFNVAADTFRLLQSGVFSAIAKGGLAADAFFQGTAAADAEDRIIYNKTTGELFYDANGVGGAGRCCSQRSRPTQRSPRQTSSLSDGLGRGFRAKAGRRPAPPLGLQPQRQAAFLSSAAMALSLRGAV